MKILTLILFFSLPAMANNCISDEIGGGKTVIQCENTVTIVTNEGISVCNKLVSGAMSCTPVKFEKRKG